VRLLSIIRARAPSVPGRQLIGESIAGFEVEDLIKASSEGTFRVVSRLDNVERIFAFRRLDDLSLTVLVGKNTDAVFADFYDQRRLYLMIGFVSAAFVLGLAVLFEIYLRAQDRIRVGEALVALQNQQTVDLIGIMDGCGAALVQTDSLGQIATCNSTFATMFGIADRSTLVGRPFDSVVAAGGGRVTEVLARPLLNLQWPMLAGIVQPLAGEYAARRSLLERVPFPVGYGVEFAILVDTLEMLGLDAIAQVDLGVRLHRHHDERRLWFTKKRVEAVDEAPGLQRLGILPHRHDVAEASRMTEELLYR
jgi:PAS domain-containing protein